jgi:uncharacterized protein (DUF58 family)
LKAGASSQDSPSPGSGLRRPFAWIQNRIDRWILRRVKRSDAPVRLRRNRIYIVPTRYGYGLGVMLLVMLLVSMNYSNNLGFMLTFLLAGIGLVGMHFTHANLLNLSIAAVRSEPVHAGDEAVFHIQLRNSSPSARYAIHAGWPHQPNAESADVPENGSTDIRLRRAAHQRGWLEAGPFAVSTEFPFGLLHAWSWVHLDQRCLVYPAPLEPGIEPPPAPGGALEGGGQREGQDTFDSLRDYRRGDPLHSIHWKRFPKLRRPTVKVFTESESTELWLDWSVTPGDDVETRLSRLTRWVIDAEEARSRYGLRLPTQTIAVGGGEAHRHACLTALALFADPQG